MALRRTIAKRLFNRGRDSPPVILIQNAAKTNFNRELVTISVGKVFRNRFLHRRSINQSARLPEFLSISVGDKLRERLWSNRNAGDRICFDGLISPADGISVHDVKKILRSLQLEKLRSALKEIPANSISYSEFVKICCEVCENREQGLENAKMLDKAGNVIILGKMVFLRPDQVAKSLEKLVYESIATPDDPRKEELQQMMNQKAQIDCKAESLVQRELYCGLGFVVVQTLGFMRLTFWELSWDVMEPICFFVTSLHFALAYGFFLRTSKEPTFEGFYQRRFKVKQAKLMKSHNFDVDKYMELCRAFYPTNNNSGHAKSSGTSVII